MAVEGTADTEDESVKKLKQAATATQGTKRRNGMTSAAVEKERKRAAQLTRKKMLHCRVRYFTAGAVIGSMWTRCLRVSAIDLA